jgi:predicted SAM-dependent methyltransferase
METIFVTYKTLYINELNNKIKEYTNEGYHVVDFKIVGSSEFDKHNDYTKIVVQMNKKTTNNL